MENDKWKLLMVSGDEWEGWFWGERCAQEMNGRGAKCKEKRVMIFCVCYEIFPCFFFGSSSLSTPGFDFLNREHKIRGRMWQKGQYVGIYIYQSYKEGRGRREVGHHEKKKKKKVWVYLFYSLFFFI